ncbi:XdhC family protein [Acidobacteria bacterium ACD]|nr:XdhC family protein [Acidobacteria bacterium ACD]
MSVEVFRALLGLLEEHPRVALATVVEAVGSTPRAAAARMVVLPGGSIRGTVGGGKFEALVVEDALRLLAGGAAPLLKEYRFLPEGEGAFGAVCGGTARVMIEVVERPPRLLVVGAGHCGRALSRLACAAGFEVTVADDRADLLLPSSFPAGARLAPVKPDLSDLPLPGPSDAVAVLSRGHVLDGVALRRLRGVPAAYLGMIGSRAKKKALFDELRGEGFAEEELARIRCPIGLPIGADSPEEIAVSILAEIVSVRRGGSGGRATPGP